MLEHQLMVLKKLQKEMELLELLELQAKLEKLKLSRDAEDAERVRDAATRGMPLDDMETQPWQFQMEPLKVHRASFGFFVFARTLFGSSPCRNRRNMCRW